MLFSAALFFLSPARILSQAYSFSALWVDTLLVFIVAYFVFQFNFVGKLLGPRGNSLKRLQEETLTKMSILGKGSMRDKAKVKNAG